MTIFGEIHTPLAQERPYMAFLENCDAREQEVDENLNRFANKSNRGDWIRTSGLLLPKQAL